MNKYRNIIFSETLIIIIRKGEKIGEASSISVEIKKKNTHTRVCIYVCR